MTPEGKVKAAIKKWLDAHGFQRAAADTVLAPKGWYYMPVNNGMGVGGIPDFMGSYVDFAFQPRPLAIEAKAPGEAAKPRQLDIHTELRAAGWLVLVVDDVSQLAVLGELLCG